jgi:hypothetical protein
LSNAIAGQNNNNDAVQPMVGHAQLLPVNPMLGNNGQATLPQGSPFNNQTLQDSEILARLLASYNQQQQQQRQSHSQSNEEQQQQQLILQALLGSQHATATAAINSLPAPATTTISPTLTNLGALIGLTSPQLAALQASNNSVGFGATTNTILPSLQQQQQINTGLDNSVLLQLLRLQLQQQQQQQPPPQTLLQQEQALQQLLSSNLGSAGGGNNVYLDALLGNPQRQNFINERSLVALLLSSQQQQQQQGPLPASSPSKEPK